VEDDLNEADFPSDAPGSMFYGWYAGVRGSWQSSWQANDRKRRRQQQGAGQGAAEQQVQQQWQGASSVAGILQELDPDSLNVVFAVFGTQLQHLQDVEVSCQHSLLGVAACSRKCVTICCTAWNCCLVSQQAEACVHAGLKHNTHTQHVLPFGVVGQRPSAVMVLLP